MLSFMDSQNFVSLIKNKTCFKVTGGNRKYSFKNTSSYKTGLSDHHHVIYSVMTTIFKWKEPKKLIYRNYLNFSQKDFQNEILLNVRDGKHNYLEFGEILWNTISMLRRKPKYFEGIISHTLIKH